MQTRDTSLQTGEITIFETESPLIRHHTTAHCTAAGTEFENESPQIKRVLTFVGAFMLYLSPIFTIIRLPVY